MTRTKRRAWLLTLLFAAGFVGGAWPMAERIAAFNKQQQFHHYHVEPIKTRTFQVQGFPPARIEDVTTESGVFVARLTYGQDGAATVRDIPVNKPPEGAINLPDLGIYDEWMRVLAINDVVRDEAGNQVPAPGSERLIIAVRRTPEGFDPGSWGSVRRTEWLFDFYDLQRDGSINFHTRRWPMAKQMYEDSFQQRAAAPDADPGLKALAAVPPLQERSLDYHAALHVIPKLNVPKYKFTDTAFSPRVMGWTLPVCLLSGLGFSFAFFFAVAPSPKPAAGRAPGGS